MYAAYNLATKKSGYKRFYCLICELEIINRTGQNKIQYCKHLKQ